MARNDPHETSLQTRQCSLEARTSPVSRHQCALPEDAIAIIERPSRSVTQAGKAREKGWLLRFQRRGHTFADPLAGWTGSDDPLAHLALRFPTREAAIRYSERHGLPYELGEPSREVSNVGGKQSFEQQQPFWICCWPTGPHALCCGNYPLLKGERNDVRHN